MLNNDKNAMNKKKKGKGFFSKVKQSLRKNFKGDIDYIQMRLPVEKITPEFEESIKKDIESKINQAEIRKAAKNDAESLINMRTLAWQSTTMPYSQMKRKSLIKLINEPDIVILLAKVNNIDSGFIISYYTGQHNDVGVIAGLGVVPSLQRQGLGKILGLASWNYFKSKNIQELRCKVYKDNNTSYNFIKSLGFEEYEGPEVGWKFF